MISYTSGWLILCLLFSGLAHARISSKRITVIPALRNELNLVLKNTDQLHTACVDQDEKSIDGATEKVISSLERAEKHSSMAQVQRTHLVKILTAAKDKLEMSQSSSGKKRCEPLKEAFKDLVQIAQVFKLERYNIFYCSKDKSLWLQKSYKPKNPINPKRFGNCGRLVR